MADFGSWLQGEIERKKMNQTEFAEAIGRSKQIVSEWISNEATPGDESIDLIARELGRTSLEVYRILRGIPRPSPLRDAFRQRILDIADAVPSHREADFERLVEAFARTFVGEEEESRD